MAHGILASRFLGRHRPLLANIEITHRCNLRCVFCDLPSERALQMPTGLALRLVDDLAATGTQSICINGGEPLLHPGLDAIVRRARRRGLRIALSTNGTLVASRLAALEGVGWLKISLDGPRDVHDAGRRSPAFDRAVEGARCAARAGFQVALRMTIGRHNATHWRSVLDVAEEIGATAIFQPAVGSLSRSGVETGPASPDVSEYRAAIRAILAAKRSGAPVANEEVTFEYLERWPEPTPVPFCVGGRVDCAVAPDGGLHRCGRSRSGRPPNVFELGVAEAFRRLEPAACASCWCVLTLATCYLYALDPRLLLGRGSRRGLTPALVRRNRPSPT